MLDKLFSREINRRTGAHAISIYIDSNTKTRKRSRSAGAKALNATKITTKHSQGSFFHRLDVRFPWLKLIATVVVCIIAILDLANFTISKVTETDDKIRIAPMSHHVKATERTLEGKKLVALTFDDGPSAATTPRLLDILTEKDLPATFFMLGSTARANPDIVRRIENDHHEIASHTMYHQNLVTIPADAARADINEAKTAITEILGHGPAYTRPPYGNLNDTVITSVGTPIILWSVDSEDWRSKDPNSIISVTMSEVYDGAIILMHDIYPTSVDAIPALVDTLRGAGYEFATISELARARNIPLNPGSIYYNLTP
ncbi:polysaccharide deacetylase family protein [Candidatus Saccharibacteria bacterium]|nr:polysaccharide deacetylase family protein [Candidatus Saccharibacteria bacterium]